MMQGKYAGMVKPSDINNARRELMRECGFYVAIDETFKRYWDSYKSNPAVGPDSIVEGQRLRLKRKIKEAIARIRANAGG